LEKFKLIGKTLAGLEEILAAELTALGAEDVEIIKRAVSFSADLEMMYKANLWCRTALRFLKPIASFKAVTNDELYNNVYEYPWDTIFNTEQTFAIDAVVGSSEFTHSQFVAQKTKDAIADKFRAKFNKRPSVDLQSPDIRINLHIFKDDCHLSLDSSGESLHKRGYKLLTSEAPMSEVLAAGLIILSGWDKTSNFVDPMCGSGTIACEAAMIAKNIAPARYRKNWGFEHWRDFDIKLWKQIKAEAASQEMPFDGIILASDISEKAVSITRSNVRSCGVADYVRISHNALADLVPPPAPGVLVTNPPYGERIKEDDIIALYKSIGDTLKKKYTDYNAWVISSDFEALKFVGLKPSRKIVIFNGPLECRFVKFSMYGGSKKAKFNP
jgi:putative N6-adenine-specific DNA methylase